MTIQLELSPEAEQRLAAEARAQGVSLEKAAEQMLQEALRSRSRADGRLSVEDFQSMLDGLAEGSEALPPLPTENFSREGFYRDKE